jgi:hypothetical protein
MNSMAVGGYRSADSANLKGGYREPYAIIALISIHRNGHYVRQTLKYLDFKKVVDLDAHVKVFNFIVKKKIETFEEYFINAFSYMLRNTTLNWCHNYMSEFHDYIFLEFTRAFCKLHWKIENDKQIYMELKNMK